MKHLVVANTDIIKFIDTYTISMEEPRNPQTESWNFERTEANKGRGRAGFPGGGSSPYMYDSREEVCPAQNMESLTEDLNFICIWN